jgi:uncharacterized protein (TIGR04255 family)
MSSEEGAPVGQKLRQAPVYFTLAQVRFNPLLALDSYVPKIQDQFRRVGYPDTKKGVLTTLNLNVGSLAGGNTPQVPFSQATRYMFSNMRRTEGFILDQAALSLQTTDYDTFEKFAGTFLSGLRIVHEAVSLSYTDRIGVRYLDAIYPRTEEDLSEYLSQSVLGLYRKLNGTLSHAFSETVIKNDFGAVVARVILQDGEIGFPPDLQPMELQVSERFRNLRGVHALLDTDGSRENRDVFDLEAIERHLTTIHAAVIEAFKAIITERALKIWE